MINEHKTPQTHVIVRILDKYNDWRSQDIPEPTGFPPPRDVLVDLETIRRELDNLSLVEDGGLTDAFDDGYNTGYDEGLQEGRAETEEGAYDTGETDGYNRGYEDAKREFSPDSDEEAPTELALIKRVCTEISDLLVGKNKAYGNSVFEPVRTFSKAPTIEQINVRIDDKLSRIKKGTEYGNEDTELDLIGYLILKRVAQILNKSKGLP